MRAVLRRVGAVARALRRVSSRLPPQQCARLVEHAARALKRRNCPGECLHRDLDRERNLARQRAQNAEKVETAVAGHQPFRTRLKQQSLQVDRPLGRSVAELRIAKPVPSNSVNFVGPAAAAVEMNRIDEDSTVRASSCGEDPGGLREILDVGPWHRFEVGGNPEFGRQVAERAEAIGKARFVPGEWIQEGAIVIDVGINRTADGKLCGDVDFDSAKERASWITPVPGGVGPMTIATLLANTLRATELRELGSL